MVSISTLQHLCLLVTKRLQTAHCYTSVFMLKLCPQWYFVCPRNQVASSTHTVMPPNLPFCSALSLQCSMLFKLISFGSALGDNNNSVFRMECRLQNEVMAVVTEWSSGVRWRECINDWRDDGGFYDGRGNHHWMIWLRDVENSNTLAISPLKCYRIWNLNWGILIQSLWRVYRYWSIKIIKTTFSNNP